MKIQLCFLLIAVFFSSCKKKSNDGPEYTIEGHFYIDCNMQPVKNEYLELIQGGSGFLASTRTDSNGYFKFTFHNLSGQTQKIHYGAGAGFNDAMIGIPSKTSYDNFRLYIRPASNMEVKLNAVNQYSSSDTLYITNFNDVSQKLKIAGPFHSGLLYMANDYGILNFSYSNNIVDLGYRINSENWIIKTLDLKICDTTKVTVDIN